MKCSQCGKDNSPAAKFCSSCGGKFEDESKSSDEVSLVWLQGVLKALGFTIDVREKDFVAKHPTSPNFIVALHPFLHVITLQTLWAIKKPGWGQKGALLAAVNKANAQSWVGIWSATEDNETLVISSHINLTSRISAQDVTSFVQSFEEAIVHGFKSSGLSEYAS